jgi:Mn-containing catalase
MCEMTEKTSELKGLLVDQLQDLLNAENQIVGALPKMVDAADNAKLKEAFEKHLLQTKGHVNRLKSALELLGESADSKPCKGMRGLLEEGAETIKDGEELDDLTADLALIAAAQKVEHYEICGYGTARYLARQLGEREVATLLSHTLGEEESADFLLTEITKPILQQATSAEFGNGTKVPWGEPGETPHTGEHAEMGVSKARAATAGGSSAFRIRKTKKGE